MKNYLPRTLLDWVLAAAVVVSVVLFAQYCRQSQQLRKIQPQYQAQAMAIQNARMQVQSLLNECAEYSKTNPSLEPVLESVGIKLAKGAKPAAPAK